MSIPILRRRENDGRATRAILILEALFPECYDVTKRVPKNLSTFNGQQFSIRKMKVNGA